MGLPRTDPQYQSKLDWVEKGHGRGTRTSRSGRPRSLRQKNADTMAILRPAAAAGGQGVVGRICVPNSADRASVRSSWRSTRSSAAPGGRRRRSAVRRPGNAEIHQLFGFFDRQKARYLQPRCSPNHLTLLFDQANWFRSQVFVTRRPAMPRNGDLDHQRREVVFHQRQACVVLYRHGRPQTEARTYEGYRCSSSSRHPGHRIIAQRRSEARPPGTPAAATSRYHDVRVPADHVSAAGQAFMIARAGWAAAEYITRCGQSRWRAEHST